MYYFIHFSGVCRKRRLLSTKAAFRAMPRSGLASGGFTFYSCIKQIYIKQERNAKFLRTKDNGKNF